MALRPSVLCPIDFSNASRAALRYATAIAEHFRGRLTVVTINDPLLNDAAQVKLGAEWLPQHSDRELRRFFEQTFEHRSLGVVDVAFEVATGTPALEILRSARERACDIIVMSAHGLNGLCTRFFGSTTERVLRETSVPVLVTPSTHSGPLYPEDVDRIVRRVLAPVDFSVATARQLQVAQGLAEAVDVPLLVAHVVEPVRWPVPVQAYLPNVDDERSVKAQQALDQLVATIPSRLRPEAALLHGDPADEIAKLACERRTGLIVMGLHASPLSGPRMGSVTYRVLCLAPTLVLAIPPVPATVSRRIQALAMESLPA